MIQYGHVWKADDGGVYMNRNKPIMIGLLLTFLVLSACSKSYQGDFSYEVKDFEFKNQDGESVSKEDLEGTFWVADFIFTNCTSACPPMTANLARVQEEIKKAGLQDKVRFVSFTIDPNHDTPDVLSEYIQSHGGELNNWDALTGYSPDRIKEFSINSFKALVDKIPRKDPAEGEVDYNFLHSSSFYIVSPNGNAIKKIDGTQFENVDKLVKELKNYIK